MLTASQRHLVHESWTRVTPQADAIAAAFYERLFHRAPEVRPLFAHADLAQQRVKLVQALALVVANLERLDTLAPTIAQLGRRHATYGVQSAHYPLVGAALLDTLAAGFGTDFTPDLRDAWAAALTLVATAMEAGANAPSTT